MHGVKKQTTVSTETRKERKKTSNRVESYLRQLIHGGAVSGEASTLSPKILYAVFDNSHTLAKTIRQDILRGGAENRHFCVFLTLEFKFLTIYEVSRPLHRRKPFIVSFIVFPRVYGTISTPTGSSNLLLNFNSVFFYR